MQEYVQEQGVLDGRIVVNRCCTECLSHTVLIHKMSRNNTMARAGPTKRDKFMHTTTTTFQQPSSFP